MTYFNYTNTTKPHIEKTSLNAILKTVFIMLCLAFIQTTNAQWRAKIESENYIDRTIAFQNHQLFNENLDTTLVPRINNVINITTFIDTSATFPTIKPINKKRVWLVVGGVASSLGISYIYANNSWWKGKQSAFHFDKDENSASIFNVFYGPDSKYAKNIDKVAHFYGGVIYSDFFSALLRSANLPAKKAGLYGALMGTAVQGFIEVKDGLAKSWGFSVLDVTGGTLGSFYTYAQNFVPAFAATDVKMSYYRHNDYYFTVPQENKHPSWTDDYMNMTFWFSYNPSRLVRHGKQVHPNWPKWLCISTGIGVDNTLDGYYTGQNNAANKGNGSYELYIAPDIDFTGILPKTKFFRTCAKVLNRVKFPLPTIRLTPKIEFYPAFF